MSMPSPIARHAHLARLWRDPPTGAARWFTAVNHSTLGRRFILTALAFFLIGGTLAMLVRTQLATPHNAFLAPGSYNQVFTMHGTIMMFLFAIPMLEGFAMYLLPKMLGARDLAFPRLGAYAYWCYVFGGLMLVVALLAGIAPASGWFMYTPLSNAVYSPGMGADVWLIGVTFAEISALCGAVELVVSILRLRAPGMSLNRMPLFAWYMLVTALMILTGFPPLILGSILLELERALGWPFFEAARGGSPLLWQHLFWMFGHPEVYIIFLPAAGMVSTLVPVLARHPMVGHAWVVAAAIALGLISFSLWAHHMFTVGLPYGAEAFFSVASMLVVVPTSIQVFAWIATLWAGRPVLRLPLLYLFGFLAIFVAGGLTGVMVALVPFDWQVHDTHFVVAHFHYVLIGGMVFPVIAAAYYWLPHFTGHMASERLGAWAFWLIFIGFNLTFLVMHLTGLLGMPRRVYGYAPDLGWDLPNLVSSIGGFLQAVGFAMLLLDLVLHVRIGKIAPRNPWEADTLEWAMPTPPPSYNFAAQPRVSSRHPLWDEPGLGARLAAGTPYPGSPWPTRRETIAVDPLSGEPLHLVVLPGPGWLPFGTALMTGCFFLALLLKLYPLAAAGMLGTAAFVLVWAWQTGARSDPELLEVGEGLYLRPHHGQAEAAPGRSGLLCALVADAMLLASLLFGWVYVQMLATDAHATRTILDARIAVALGGLTTLAAAYVALRRASTMNEHGRAPGSWVALATMGNLLAAIAFVTLVCLSLPQASRHAQPALCTALFCYMAIHAGIGTLMTGFATLRQRAGFISPLRDLDLANSCTWTAYTGLASAAALTLMYGM